MNEILAMVGPTVVSGLVQTVIDTHIKPRLEEFYYDKKKDKKPYLISDKFDEYITRTYNNNLYMNTIVFKNQQKKIYDLYIPLIVSKSHTENDDNHDVVIDKYKDDFIPFYKKVLLVDNAGMGKSTILKFLYLQSIIENKGVPIFIELRKLGKNTSIIDFIMDEINGLSEYFNKEEILSLIEGGDFIFFFDGYDEINNDNKKEVTDNLQNFISKTSQNEFIISSRDEAYLGCFSDFQRFDIKPLIKEKSYDLIRKYDKNGTLSKELIERLENDSSLTIIDEFLENPLMVSLLYKAFEYKRSVPYKKQIFYRQVYDALFQDHDRMKGGAYEHPKKSKLDIEDFHKILRALGILSLSKGVSYCKEELIEMISKAKRIVTGVNFKENQFIDDITRAVPLFVRDGIEYRWAHKSFQEYFAACYICFDAKEQQDDYLIKMTSDEKITFYYNVLDFCYDIDYKKFRKTIIYPFVKDFIDYYNNSYQDDQYNEYDDEVLDLRKSINFMYQEIFMKFLDENEKNKTDIKDKFNNVFGCWRNPRPKGALYSINTYNNTQLSIATGFQERSIKIKKLIQLLSSKNSSLLKKKYKNVFMNELETLEQIINNEPFIINDHTNNMVSEEDFKIINDYLISEMFDFKKQSNFLLDYNECIKLKKMIEKEINSEDDIFI